METKGMLSAKPRSMTAGARNVLRSNDSASLWNCTLSPGWTDEESETLRKALMKFGIGNWAKIIESSCLPGKTNAQMNLQLQRLLGQQSTAEFAGLHIDPKVIGAKNAKIQGPHIKRKNNCIVNTGGKLSREELKKRVISNKEEYELPESEWKDIVLPKVADPLVTLELKREDLKRLQSELEKVQACITRISDVYPTRMDKLKFEMTTKLPSPATTPMTPGTPTSAESPSSITTAAAIEKLNIKQKGIKQESSEEEEEDVDMDQEEGQEEYIIDEDLLMAMQLQKEENALAGIMDSAEEEEEISDDDFATMTSTKKRKISTTTNTKGKKKVTRK